MAPTVEQFPALYVAALPEYETQPPCAVLELTPLSYCLQYVPVDVTVVQLPPDVLGVALPVLPDELPLVPGSPVAPLAALPTPGAEPQELMSKAEINATDNKRTFFIASPSCQPS